MPPPNFPLFVSSLLIIILFLSIAVPTYCSQDILDNIPFVTSCYGDNLTSSTPYDSNLRLLFANLIASTPNSTSFFSLINYTSPQIFGLAQCRPDITPSDCASCLNQSAVATTNNKGCGLKKSFANRARNCLLRYSDQMFSIYNAPEEQMFVYFLNEQNASASFNRQVNVLMNSVIASAGAAALRFAVGVTNESVGAQNIHGMGWCSMVLSSSDCSQCLRMALGRLPAGKDRGDGGTVSCEVRFETYQFYSNSTVAAPAMEAGGDSGKKRMTQRRLTIFLSLGMFLIISIIVCLIWLKKRRIVKETSNSQTDQTPIIQGTDWASKLEIRDSSLEFSLISFSSIVEATCNFSTANKLGEGGFGSVYKGQLSEGKSIAVKRLDACSGQGLEEFMNEIRLIAKLQHQNLVKLLGCCVEGDEKLLVYEYMPNNSLDYHLFDPVKKEQLDWSKRFAIIEGITQGLLYLHKYSRVRIIHRDLKASNILLDLDMNPKISDFGMARIFDANTTQANTNRIVGTYGYMSPEYAMEGIFSIKSDVFSFGVMMLEIISGKRNTIFHKSGKALNLLTHAWELWKSGCLLDFVDPSLHDKIFINEVLKCIIVGLVCVQENAIDRPTMPKVIAMLGSDNTTLPNPKKPAFFIAENEEASKLWINELATQNDVSFSVLEGR